MDYSYVTTNQPSAARRRSLERVITEMKISLNFRLDRRRLQQTAHLLSDTFSFFSTASAAESPHLRWLCSSYFMLANCVVQIGAERLATWAPWTRMWSTLEPVSIHKRNTIYLCFRRLRLWKLQECCYMAVCNWRINGLHFNYTFGGIRNTPWATIASVWVSLSEHQLNHSYIQCLN